MEPFKNAFNEKLIKNMAHFFSKSWPEFRSRDFIKDAKINFEDLELKERSNQITVAMKEHLPSDFAHAANILLASLGEPINDDKIVRDSDKSGLVGWAIMPMAEYVGLHGWSHYSKSMDLFKEMTQRFTCEFGIRHFILKDPKKTIKTINKWTKNKDRHVRRLASEGIRPRLPWAMQLETFIKNPEPIIEILEQLKDDPEEYVRRSVANNLNDISKDHSQIISELSEKWIKGATQNRHRLLKHACRTLIKNGDKKILSIFGYTKPKLKKIKLTLLSKKIKLGEALNFKLSLGSLGSENQPLLIDYVIHHVKKNGSNTPKVFKWTIKSLPSNSEIEINKKHSFKTISTRIYYGGVHKVDIMINGSLVASSSFTLIIPS